VFAVRYKHLYIRSKAIPITGSGGLYGWEMLRIPSCLDTRLTDVCVVVRLTRRTLLYSQETFYPLLVLISVRG
jgi:hypothetical protein